MADFTYSLEKTSYSWQNALLWGNFAEHCKKAAQGSCGNRIVHVLIAVAEFLPIIGQIASLFEKLIVDHFSTSALTDKEILIETGDKKHDKIPSPNLQSFSCAPSIVSSNESLEEFKSILLSKISETINSQQVHKTYKRGKLIPLNEHKRNLPIPLNSLSKKTGFFSQNAVFNGYNAEGIEDYGWGCAWRAIQTCLSAYNIDISFEVLFHLFGPRENLEFIYQNKYPAKELSSLALFAPYDLGNGWAEPFIGHMVMHFYGIPSALESVNKVPGNCNAPKDVFLNKPLDFKAFRDRLESHFNTANPAPVMIDDGTYTFNIIGIEKDGLNTTLWIADPHIKEGANRLIDREKSPVGLYTIILNDRGKQVGCSLNNEDKHQVSHLFTESHKQLHFESRCWTVLFPC